MLHYIILLRDFQDVWYDKRSMSTDKSIHNQCSPHHIQHLIPHCNQIHICNLSSRAYNPSSESPQLISLTAMSISLYILLNRFEVLAVTYFTNEPPEHIRQPFNNKVAAFYIMRAHLAAIKLRTACARRTRIHRTYSRTVFPVSAFPIITCHYITPP